MTKVSKKNKQKEDRKKKTANKIAAVKLTAKAKKKAIKKDIAKKTKKTKVEKKTRKENVKKIVFFDLDDTIVEGQSQQHLIKYLYKKKEVSFFDLTMIMSWFLLYKLHLIKDPSQIMRIAFYRIMRGRKIEEVRKMLKDFYKDELSDRMKEKLKSKIKKHKKEGCEMVLMTNAIEPLAEIVAAKLKMDRIIATKLEQRKGIYTGRINGDIIYGKQKMVWANRLMNDIKGDVESWAYADHRSDADLFCVVEHAILVDPSSKNKKFYKDIYEKKNLQTI